MPFTEVQKIKGEAVYYMGVKKQKISFGHDQFEMMIRQQSRDTYKHTHAKGTHIYAKNDDIA